MDLNNVRRVSSAGYRLPERTNGTRPTTTRQPAADRTRQAKGDPVSPELNPDRRDPVKQDRVWKEMVWSERRGVREWLLELCRLNQYIVVHREKNWNFLRDYDQMGQLKSEEPLPSYMSFFSDRVPNTTNQMFGSRLSTQLGSDLVRLDRLLLWSGSNHKRKLDPEMLPC